MKEDVVASARYARALFDAAEKAGESDRVREDLEELVRVMQPSGLRAFLESPRHSPEAKKKAVARVAGMLRSQFSGGLLHLLLRKSRLAVLAGVLRHFTALLKEARGALSAELVAAGSPNEAFKRRIIASLERITRKKIELVVRQEPGLVGGFKVRMGNDLIDASVHTRLETLKRQLLETQVN